MPESNRSVPIGAAVRFRDELRQARAATARNAESFAEIVRVIERIGRFCGGRGHGLHAFKREIEGIVNASPMAADVPACYPRHLDDFAVLYESTRLGRNLAVHEGAYARNVAQHAVQLALLLEDAMQKTMKLARHFMVRAPTCAEPWEPIALVRQKMLANAFSFLPVRLDSEEHWRLVSDRTVAEFLRKGNRKDALKANVTEASQQGLELTRAGTVHPDDEVDS